MLSRLGTLRILGMLGRLGTLGILRILGRLGRLGTLGTLPTLGRLEWLGILGNPWISWFAIKFQIPRMLAPFGSLGFLFFFSKSMTDLNR